MRRHSGNIKIIGIDPGYDRLGIALIEKSGNETSLLFSTCIVTKKTNSFFDRLHMLGQELESIIDIWKPSVLAIENLFITKNQKTASRVSEARGMILYVAKTKGLSIFEYTPLEIKSTVAGYGKASKNQMATMVNHSIKLSKVKHLDDEIDAIAIALTCLYRDIPILSTTET